MKAYLTATRLATKLQMLRSGKKSKSFVVVEGMTDFRLYSKIFDHELCEVIIGENKQNVVDAIKMCEEQKLKGIIGIVDADFWHLEKERQLPDGVFLTDDHDLECMMLRSLAYEDVLLEYGDLKKIARFEERRKSSIKEILLENIAYLGYLRKLSIDQHLELNFSQLEFTEFVYVSELEINQEKLINSVIFHSKKQNIYSDRDIKNKLRSMINPTDDLWQVCCGHDLMELFTLGLVELFGNYNAKKLFSGPLEGSFRLAYQKHYFEETKLYKALIKWEKESQTFYLFEQGQQKNVI